MMRLVMILVVFGLAVGAVHVGGAALAGEGAHTGEVTRAVLELSDGSRLVGVPALTVVPLQTTFAKMEIPLAKIVKVSLETNRESVTIQLGNGDKLSGALGLSALGLATCFGKVSISVDLIRSVAFSSGASVGLPAGLAEGLVLYYSFDNDEGEKDTDKSGKGHHGVVTGAKWVAQGKVGGACSLNGIGDFVRATNYKGVLGSKSMTVCAWARSDAYNRGGQYIVAWGEPGAGGVVVSVGYNGADDHSIFGRLGGLSVFGGRAPQGDGVWHHVAMVIDDSLVSLYIDGQLVKSERVANGVNVRGKDDVTIGQGWGGCYLTGAVDEVMIFERALSADDVKAVYSVR